MMFTIILGGVHYGKKRRHFTKEFKVEAVRLIIDESRRILGVARELGVT